MSDGWVNMSPMGRMSRELDRLVQIEADLAYYQAYGVAWSLAILRCTTAEVEIEEAKARVQPSRETARAVVAGYTPEELAEAGIV